MDFVEKYIKAFQFGNYNTSSFGGYQKNKGFDPKFSYYRFDDGSDMTGTFNNDSGTDISTAANNSTLSNMSTGTKTVANATQGTNAVTTGSGGSIVQSGVDNPSNNGSSLWLNKNAGNIGQGMNVAAGVINSQNKNKDDYALSNYNDGNAIEGTIGAFGPWGQLIGGAINMGAEAAAAYGGGTDEYGRADDKGKYEAGQTMGAMIKPWEANKKIDAQKELMTDSEKKQFGNTTAGQLTGIILPGVGGHQAAKNQEAIANRRATHEKELDAKNKEFEKNQKELRKNQELYNRTMLNSQHGIMVAKRGGLLNYQYEVFLLDNSKTIDRYERKPFKMAYTETKPKVKMFRNGNIIPTGAYHHTSNNLGDMGLPVVDDNGVKIFEIETKELILGPNPSEKMTNLVKEYNVTGDDSLLKEIANIAKEELIKNTHSYNDEYACLNTGSCKLKN